MSDPTSLRSSLEIINTVTDLPKVSPLPSPTPSRKSTASHIHTHNIPPQTTPTLLELALLKILYFCSGPVATQFFFLPLIYEKNLGFNGTQIGILGAVPPFLAMVTAPVFSFVADYTQTPRGLMGVVPVVGSFINWVFIVPTCSFGLAIVVAALSTIFITAMTPMLDAMCLQVLRGQKELPSLSSALRTRSLSIIRPSRTSKHLTVLGSYSWAFHPDFIAFLLAMAALGTAFTITTSFAWLYTSTTLHASNTLLGLVGVFGIIIELPFFFTSKQVIAFLGNRWAIFVAGVGMAVRLGCYTLLTERTVWGVLGVEMLHGFSFSLMWVSAVGWAEEAAPKGMKSTAQGLITGMYSGLGPGLGGVVGGVMVRRFGYVVMFRCASGFMAVTILVYGVVGVLVGRKGKMRKEDVEEVVVDREMRGQVV
ncbi:hypothetical protein HDV00_004350 [Rhizophlyctis rosea]|nr:hypothetical protein HDV00_004350 [Rhizophlyctis rosea]